MSEDKMITWHDDESKAKAMEQFTESQEAYDGISKSFGYRAYRNFKDIEPNISVRPGYNSQDYHAFRSEEAVPHEQKRIIKMCMDAYQKVGIIRNVIDLMGDFGSQGISLVHQNKSAEKFFNQWFKKVDGKERSERFLNNLYRCGNVIIYRSNANVTPELSSYMKSTANDIKVELPNIEKNVIPWRYNFFNPSSVNMKDGNLSLFMGKKAFSITSRVMSDNFKKGDIPAHVLDTLPPKVKRAIKRGDKEIPLDPERLSVFYYKKDDWQQWANPMIYAILDDIIMLEKMRLADLSALDGAISNIRLWTLGDLEHKILPNKSAIDKLRNILTSNVGGGTMELVWGPELSYTESNSQVYKFLGSEKYSSVLNSIYAGLGVPPTLTGIAGQSGGFTNNFISLKTLVERLQYGRGHLVAFWQKEIELVRKAMGFRHPAHIHFDQMSLADDAAEKNLLLQLADRDIISHETVLERFKEIPDVEKIRLKREVKERSKEGTPNKAGPYHNPEHEQDLEKIGLQAGKLHPNDVGLETKVPDDVLMPKPNQGPGGGPGGQPNKEKKGDSKPDDKGGRPKFKQDKGPRKKRKETPKSKPGLADLIVWSQNAFDIISETVTEAYLKMSNKKNLRQVTKSEMEGLEKIKLDVLSNIDPLGEVTEESIHEKLFSGCLLPADFGNLLSEERIHPSSMAIDAYRKRVVGCYIEYLTQQ